jgi:gamma-glutamyltranspeptidase/glutathione hydrolase
MVATSHPLATYAAVRAIDRGGNAVDAALAAAGVLCTAEPSETGVGGDACALVHRDGEVIGALGIGRAPARLAADRADFRGPRSVTVPGAVAAWADLAERFGRLGLDNCLRDAIDVAAAGTVATPRVADLWQRAETEGLAPWPAPATGGRYAVPGLANTLRSIAENGPSAFYTGPTARAIAAASWLSEQDLAAHLTEWTTPPSVHYLGATVLQLPPPSQGAVSLMALELLAGQAAADDYGIERLHAQIEAVKLAFRETLKALGDGVPVGDILDPASVAALRAEIGPVATPAVRSVPRGPSDTTYLACVDGDGLAVSFIQSLAKRFGSGVVVPGTGIVLNNRASGFSLAPGHPNALAPGRRPFHTIIPGMLLRKGGADVVPFGVMGGPMQPQGHVQLVDALVGRGLDPQTALGSARFMVRDDGVVALEPGLWEHVDALRRLGHDARRADDRHQFGVGQAIAACAGVRVGGSDPRGDGSVGVSPANGTNNGGPAWN